MKTMKRAVRGDARADLLIVILLLIALGVAWVWTGGPNRAQSHAGGLFSAPWPLGSGGGNAYNVPLIPLSGSATGTPGAAYSGGTAYGGASGQTASYADYIRIDATNAGSGNPVTEYVAIQTSSALPGSITLTGWYIQDSNGTRAPIGLASSALSQGTVNTTVPVTMNPGSVAYITAGPSPVGVSFRTNICSGYLAQFQSFVPPLRHQCPSPSEELYSVAAGNQVSQACSDFVASIPACSVVNGGFPSGVSGGCQNFVETTLTYNGCAARHESDPGFYQGEWRIYLGSAQPLWGTHGTITLLDQNGNKVASANY